MAKIVRDRRRVTPRHPTSSHGIPDIATPTPCAPILAPIAPKSAPAITSSRGPFSGGLRAITLTLVIEVSLRDSPAISSDGPRKYESEGETYTSLITCAIPWACSLFTHASRGNGELLL